MNNTIAFTKIRKTTMKLTTMNIGGRLAATKITHGFRSCITRCVIASLLVTLSSASAAEDKSTTAVGPAALFLDASYEKRPMIEAPLEMGANVSPAGAKITANTRSLQMNGKPWVPVVGEFHYTRYPETEWRDELLKMKAGGLDTVATYVFWVHHEEEQGKFDWTGRRSLRRFLQLCQEVGLKAIVRMGPWCHGEVVNGGFPHWVSKKGYMRGGISPEFMKWTNELFREEAKQMEGLLWKDGGPVIGVQLDNECPDPAYLLELKKVARSHGVDVPLYTMTGWNGVPIPPSGLFPVFGAYADGFWCGTPRDFWCFYVFTDCRDNGDMGAQFVNKNPERGMQFAKFPHACAEIGAGMQTSYNKRIKVAPEDVAAISVVKLGNGNNMPGYYMYHGGVNPKPGMQETSPNKLPVMDYDFDAPLGSCGQVRPTFGKLRQHHLFLQAWGDRFAECEAYFPEVKPVDVLDETTMRWSARVHSNGSGFIFFTNHQSDSPLPEKKDVQFRIKLPSNSAVVPAQPLTIGRGSYGFFPFNMDCDGVIVNYATVQPLTRMDAGKEGVFYFFKEIPGVRPELTLAGKAPQVVSPSRHSAITLTGKDGRNVSFVVLSEADASSLYRVSFAGQERIVLSSAVPLQDPDGLRLEKENGDHFEASLFPGLTSIRAGKAMIKATSDGIFSRFELVQDLKIPSVSVAEVSPAKTAVGNAFLEDAWVNAAVYRLEIPKELEGRRVLLNVNYIGDGARVYVEDQLIYDHFYNADPLALPLWRIPPHDWPKLRVKVMPASAELAQAGSGSLGAVIRAKLSKMPPDPVTVTVAEQVCVSIAPVLEADGADRQRQGSTLYDPAEPYDVNAPLFPIDYTEEQKAAQREAGIALIKEYKDAISLKRTEYRAKPGVYRLPKGMYFDIGGYDKFALYLSNCEIIMESVERSLFHITGGDYKVVGPVEIDFDPMPYTLGRIVASQHHRGLVTVEILPGYPALKAEAEPKNRKLFYTYSPAGIWRPNSSWSQFDWKDAELTAGGRTVTFTADKNLKPDYWDRLYSNGNLVALGEGGPSWLFNLHQVANLTLEDVNFYGGSFCLGIPTETCTLTRVRGKRRPGTNRLYGGGGYQSSNRKCRVTMDSCEFRTSYDDLLDMHSSSMDMVWQQTSPREIVVWTSVFRRYQEDVPGSLFEFYKKDFTHITSAKLVSAQRFTDEEAKPLVGPAADLINAELKFSAPTNYRAFWRLKFDNDLTLVPGTLVEDIADRQMELVMRNCVWYDSGVRVMIQSGNRIELTNNHFVRIAGGLEVKTDSWWWQGATVHNVLIANNVLLDCNYGSLWGSGSAAISVNNGVNPIAGFPERYPNDNIVIRDNRIEGSSAGAIIVQNSDKVQITGNACRNLFQLKPPTAAIHVEGARNLTLSNNRIENCPAPAIKVDWINGLQCNNNTASNLGTDAKPVVMVDLGNIRDSRVQNNVVKNKIP